MAKTRPQRRHPVRNTATAQQGTDAVLKSIIALADAGDPGKALAVASQSGLSTDAIRNACAICLLRMGRVPQALNQFKSLVLASGCTWMKEGLPTIYQANFCVALIVAGHPGGANELLKSIPDQRHPSVVRLRGMLAEWEHSLSFWQRVQWKLGLEPDLPATVPFAPGDFVETAPSSPAVASGPSSAAATPEPVTPHNAA